MSNISWSIDPIMLSIGGWEIRYYVICMWIASSIILIVFSNFFFDRKVSDTSWVIFCFLSVIGCTLSLLFVL